MSGLLSILVLSVIVSSLVVFSLSLHSRLLEESRRAALEVSQTVLDSVNPPVISLDTANGSLEVEIYSSAPIKVSHVIALLQDSRVVIKRVGEEVDGFRRVTLLDNYSCEKVKVLVVLERGNVVYWSPERDPRIGSTPSSWDGWFACELSRVSSVRSQERGVAELSRSLRVIGYTSARVDPLSFATILEARAPQVLSSKTLTPRVELSFTLSVYGDSLIVRTPERSQRSGVGSVEVAVVDLGDGVKARVMAHAKLIREAGISRLQYVWLTLSTENPSVFKGSIEVVYPRPNYYLESPSAPTGNSLSRFISALAYSPRGSQSFYAITSFARTDDTRGIYPRYHVIIESEARGLYETNGPIVILYNGLAN
ncbi:MAG: hypothetical protein QXF57_00795, partial [Acidilobaceae archaeon]